MSLMPGIHKALYRRAAEVKQLLVSTLHQEKWSLHFDGKKSMTLNTKQWS
ncbi:Hypothetical protein FKW44_020559 [Caligus rogercresseyi]|uniref:Uncharacterized protein n=1 Tax=Caligus rogercresseyi TaxID=217165 RepID=A0A7T8GXH4_CALRO|nr:Hypothetical protein FKW44_020559 [Caligus rogercresseyi]